MILFCYLRKSMPNPIPTRNGIGFPTIIYEATFRLDLSLYCCLHVSISNSVFSQIDLSIYCRGIIQYASKCYMIIITSWKCRNTRGKICPSVIRYSILFLTKSTVNICAHLCFLLLKNFSFCEQCRKCSFVF